MMVTANGERHGLINTIPNSIPAANCFKNMSPEKKKEAEALKKEESRIVKAKYINHRGMNERLEKPYMRWAGDNIQTYRLIPGEAYDLPMGFIKEVNDPNKRLKRRSEVLDSRGIPTQADGPGEQIHELVPISF
jgi:hypothetical protein